MNDEECQTFLGIDWAEQRMKNGAQAKAGLNRSIHASAWGKVRRFTTYKAARMQKLVISVPPHHTSQECSKCSHTHPDKRLKQELFVCRNCGFTSNADSNAAVIIKKRGIKMLRDRALDVKSKTSTMRLRKKSSLGQELAEGMHRGEGRKTPAGLPASALPSRIRETPTTTILTV